MEITKNNLQMARDSILGLAASFFIHGIVRAFMGTPGSIIGAITNLSCTAILLVILLLPKRARLAAHIATFLVLSFGLIAVNQVIDAEGHLLLIFSTFVWCHYGIPRGRKAFVLLGLALFWMAAVAISAAGYISEPPQSEPIMRVRVLRGVQYMFLYMGVTLQLWIVAVRPRKQLREQYDRKIAHLDEIADRYRHLIRDRLIRPNEPGPDRTRILDIAMELMSDARAEGMMTKEELSFLHHVIEDCRRECSRVSSKMNAAISEARHLLGGDPGPHSRSV